MTHLDRYYADRDRVTNRTPQLTILGDWCETCAGRGDPRPVRFPHTVAPDGLAHYRCHRCCTRWTCWWALERGEAS